MFVAHKRRHMLKPVATGIECDRQTSDVARAGLRGCDIFEAGRNKRERSIRIAPPVHGGLGIASGGLDLAPVPLNPVATRLPWALGNLYVVVASGIKAVGELDRQPVGFAADLHAPVEQ